MSSFNPSEIRVLAPGSSDLVRRLPATGRIRLPDVTKQFLRQKENQGYTAWVDRLDRPVLVEPSPASVQQTGTCRCSCGCHDRRGGPVVGHPVYYHTPSPEDPLREFISGHGGHCPTTVHWP